MSVLLLYNARAGRLYSGDDFLMSYGGNDTIHGGQGVDWAYGGDGQDVIHGEGGADYLDGQAYGDTYYDVLDGFSQIEIARTGSSPQRFPPPKSLASLDSIVLTNPSHTARPPQPSPMRHVPPAQP